MNKISTGDSSVPDIPPQNQAPPLPIRSFSIGKLGSTPVKKNALSNEIGPIFEKVKKAIKNSHQGSVNSDGIAGRVVYLLGSEQDENNAAKITALRSQIDSFNADDRKLLGVINQVLQLDDQITRDVVQQAIQIRLEIRNKDEEKLKILLEGIPSETLKRMANLKNREGTTIWHLIANTQNLNIVKMFAERLPEAFESSYCMQTTSGYTPLHYPAGALDSGGAEVAEVIAFMFGKAPEKFVQAMKIMTIKGNARLPFSLMSHQPAIAELFAKKFPDEFKKVLLSTTKKGNMPFHLAASKGNYALLKLIGGRFPELFQEMMSNANNEGQTPVHLAIKNTLILKLMLKKAPRQFEIALLTKDAKGRTPIHYAVYKDQPRSVGWLKDHAKDQLNKGMTLQDKKGLTPVHMALSLEDPSIMKILADNVPTGVNEALLVQNAKGNSPLHLAVNLNEESLPAYFELLNQMPNFPVAMRKLNDHGDSVLALIRRSRNLGYKDLTSHIKKNKALHEALIQETKEIFQRRAVAHALNIEGRSLLVRRAEKTKIQSTELEGHHTEQWFNMMRKDFIEFNKQYRELDPSQIVLFQDVFELGANSNSISLQEKYNKISGGEPVVLSTGFRGHAVTVLFWGDQIVICDRGGVSRRPIEVYHFDRTKLEITDLEAIEDIVYIGKSEDYKKLFFRDLSEKLNFTITPLDKKLMEDNPLPYQTVGNCSFVSPVTAMYALLILSEMKKGNIDTNAPNKVDFNRIKRKSVSIYHAWLGFQQMKVLQRLIVPIRDKNSIFEPDHKLILKALRKAYLLPLSLQNKVVLEKLVKTYTITLSPWDSLMVRADLSFRAFQRNLALALS